MNNKKCILCNNIKFSKLFKKNNYQVVECVSCNFIFLNPPPNKSQLVKYYKNFDYQTGFINENLIRRDSIKTLKNLKKLGYDNGSLLDIGCGAGFFLDEARKFGWEVQGIDTSEITSSYGKNKLKLEIINSNFLDYKFPESKFRVITLLQVIEHLNDPTTMIKKIYKLLEPNGILCIATPNIESYLSRILKNNFNYMIPPEHISFYSPQTLKTLLKNANFRIVKTFTWSYSSDLAAIIKYKLKKDNSSVDNKRIVSHKINKISFVKRMKSILFDEIFCKVFYRILNYNNGGSMIEIYAKK